MQAAQAQLGYFLEAAPDAMLVAGSDGRIVLVNHQLEELFGHRREELLGSSLEALIPGRYRAQHTAHFARYFADPRTRPMAARLDLSALRKDGSEFPAEISLAPLRLDGRTWAVAAIRDVTDHVRTEAALRAAKQAAQAADAAKTRLLAMLSHEIRTPLTALLGFADLLLDPQLGESERSSYAMIIRRNSEYLLATLNDILDVSKIEAGEIEIASIEFSPADLLLELRALMQVRAVHRGLSFAVEQETEIPAVLRGDPARLRQVIMNLVGNAVKSTERGGVHVTAGFQRDAASTSGQLVVRVSDTGPGTHPSQSERAFQPSSQADASPRRRFADSDLGLSICAPIAQALGGALTVDRRPGRGSTCTLSVPVGIVEQIATDAGVSHEQPAASELPQASSARPPIVPPPLPGASSPAGPNQPRVLVIDDSADIQALVATRLSSEPLIVQSALSGREGLAAALDATPDLVLLDVELPDLSGLALCRALKADPRTTNVPVLFLTGAEDTATKTAAFDLGAIDYVTKPFDPIELRARVRAALRTKKYQDLLATRARLDALTGLWNRGYFETRLRDELSASARHEHCLCVAILDLDLFKNINDSYGHPFGDHVLQTVSVALQKSLRTSDVACRYGGEEFAVILPETNGAQGVLAAERIRKAIESLPLAASDQPVRVTVSIGLAAYDAKGPQPLAADPGALVEIADAALYRAKHAGRNRVVMGE